MIAINLFMFETDDSLLAKIYIVLAYLLCSINNKSKILNILAKTRRLLNILRKSFLKLLNHVPHIIHTQIFALLTGEN